VRTVRHSIPWIGVVLLLIGLTAARQAGRPAGEPDVPGDPVATRCTPGGSADVTRSLPGTAAGAARAMARPTRLDPLVAL
jgi:hypothetical protein